MPCNIVTLTDGVQNGLAPQHRETDSAAIESGHDQSQSPDPATLLGVSGAIGLGRQYGDACNSAYPKHQHQHMRRKAGGEVGLIVRPGMADHHHGDSDHDKQARAS